MSSIDTSTTRRRFSDSQVPRSNLDRLLVPEVAVRGGLGGDSSSSKDRGAFETIGRQLELEEKLHILSQQLLQSYKETQQWACVGQLAQGLIASSQRVGQLKQQLESLRERAGGLFLESIRERSLPREDDHAPGADHQSLEERDTTKLLIDAEGSSRIPVEQDTPDSFEQATSEFVQPSAVDHEESADSLSGAADLSLVPATSPTEELKERPQEAGVKNTDEQRDAEPSTGGDLEPDSSAGVSEKREETLAPVESLEQPCAAELGKDNVNSSVPSSAPETVRGDTPPFEDASSSNLLVDISASSTTEDQVETAAEEKLEVDSAVDEFEKEAIVVPPSGSELLSPPATVQEAAAPIKLNSSCQQVEEEKEEIVSKADCDSVELERDKDEKATSEPLSPSKSESPPPPSLAQPQALEEFELASSDLQQGTTDESEAPLDIESEDSKLDQSTPPTTVAHTEEAREETSKHQQSIEQVDITPLTTESLGETHHVQDHLLGDNDGLGPTKSASSIDREFGLVDDCLDELTSEIEALVVVSELSSETSEQFFSPPESITLEVEYEDSLLLSEPRSLKEIAKEAAALVDQVVLPLEEKVEVKSEREKSPESVVGDSEEAVKETTDTFDTKDSGEAVDTEINFERESSDSKESSPGIIGEIEEGQLTVSPETETKEVSLGEEEEDSRERQDSPEITFKPGGELELKEAILGEKEDNSREKEESPKVVLEYREEEQKETSDTVDFEPQTTDIPPPEQKETSGTVDSEPKDTDLPQEETSNTIASEPKDTEAKETSDTVEQIETSGTVDSESKDTPPPIAEIDKSAAQFNKEEINPIIDSDVATISETAAAASTTAGVQDFQQTEEYTQEGDKMEPKLAITYSVRKLISATFSDDNKLGTTVYRIDPVSSENGHTCTQSTVISKPVERCLEEFIKLHQKLQSLEEEQLPNGGGEGMVTRGVPQLNLGECKLDSSTRENGAFNDKEREGGEELIANHESEILEAFLNQVVNSPYFQNEPIITNFLSPNEDDTSTPSPLTNGVKEREQGAESSVDDVIVNGRVASEEDTSTTEQGMDVYMCLLK